MSYLNAEIILPKELVQVIQKYIDGETIYIPKRGDNHKSWGSQTDTKKVMALRNRNIFMEYETGQSVSFLAEKYFLSEKSIYRIILNQRKCG